jgi:CheY-like chemotaxis protein
MARLIDDLLDVSRIARGKLALQTQTCDLATIVQQTAEDYRASLEAAGLQFVVSDAPAPIWVEGDPVRLAQVIGNLLNNAGRFTDRGGRVELHVCADEERRVATMAVQDSGIGIDAALLARLFDPFSQATQDLARSKGGLGLGLALTKGLVELHGGSIAVQSEGSGRGAAFVVRMPLARAVEAAPRAAREPSGQGALRVLVVEDNRDAAETLGELLRIWGHEVQIAYDGVAALTMARDFRPDVVICDIGLPGELNGYSVARRLRSEPGLEDVHLVALSGYANDDARRRSRAAGFDAHLAKPPDVGVLERMIAERSRSEGR